MVKIEKKRASVKRKPGRPSTYSKALSGRICDRLIAGESLRSICRDVKMPAARTVFKWLEKYPEFMHQYAYAREIQADTLFDEILEIADDASHDTVTTDSGEQPNSEWIARSRLRVDARKWMASKLAPKKYGDRITHAGDASAPVALILNGSDVHG